MAKLGTAHLNGIMNGSMRRRRSNGEGTIAAYKREGKIVAYRGKITIEGRDIWGPLTEKRSDALPKLREKLLKLGSETEAPRRSGPKLSTSIRILIENRLVKEWRPKTVSLARTVLTSIIGSKPKAMRQIPRAAIADYGVNDITSDDVLQWRLSLQVQASTAHRYQRMLEQFLSLLGNPVKAAKPKVREPEIRILTREEQVHLLNRAVQPRTRLALAILLNWGLRSGEACGLMHEDRHEDGILLRRQVIENNGQVIIDENLKTDDSRAWLPFMDDYLDAEIGAPRTGFVLATRHGTPMRPSKLRNMVQSVAEFTSYEGITPHEIRHTAGVNLLRAGVDPATAASITRHSIDTLLKIYHRVSQESKKEALAKVKAWKSSA